MARADVEVVRGAYEAFNRRDIAAVTAALDPDVDFRTTVETYHGAQGVADWIRQADEVFESFEIAVLEIFEAGGAVVAVVREHGRGRDSGIEIDHRFTHVWSVEDGRIAQLRAFTDRAAALETLGARD